ncbi:GNAT family N-acetyltransferase [Streptomyces sp. T21Q-yed]|uniref:GNAT family N-acetyltransferase n=1 Tax=Streptomyces sp. T21Q-yed TaxID=3018441 RepID=UPI0023DEADA7|nr:GNAT family N-acetyltransferase [Streptomyces sp. T21Q-yed]MDF3149369.1 GNAT family N-acetyltransferase [Streptomyces sp. T21Q-yed]
MSWARPPSTPAARPTRRTLATSPSATPPARPRSCAGSTSVPSTAGAASPGGSSTPPNPRHLAERYPSGETAQLRRVYVRPEHRRRGLARRLVDELLAFAVADGGYRAVYLHTDPKVPGAEGFWRSLGKVVHDEREEPGGGHGIVHFEIPMER